MTDHKMGKSSKSKKKDLPKRILRMLVKSQEHSCAEYKKGNIITVPYEAQFGEGNGTPLQYSCLANPMDRGAW